MESTTDVGTLDKASGNTLVFKDFPLTFGQPFASVPAALLLFQGVHYKNAGYNIIFYQINKDTLTNSGCTVRAYNWGPVSITMVRFSLAVGDVSIFWTSPVIWFRAPNGEHPWVKRAPGMALLDAEANLPPISDEAGYVAGVLGFEYGAEKNLRIIIN